MTRYKPIIISLLGLILVGGCEDLPDEQFEKYVLFARNGFVDREFEYQDGVTLTMDLSVSVSGTSALDHAVSVTITEDPDTLALYNEAKFGDETNDYYEALPDSCYSFGSRTGEIRAGGEYGLIPLEIIADKVDKYHRYVLPLRISGTSGYTIAPAPADAMLLKISFTNDYSGNYVYAGTLNGRSVSGDFILNVVDEDECFFYLDYEGDGEKVYPPVLIRFNADNSLMLGSRPADGIGLEQIDTDTQGEAVNLYEVDKNKMTLTISLGFRYTDPDDQQEKTFFGRLIMALEEDE